MEIEEDKPVERTDNFVCPKHGEIGRYILLIETKDGTELFCSKCFAEMLENNGVNKV